MCPNHTTDKIVLGKRFVAATIAIFWIAAISRTAWSEVRYWRIGADGLSWNSQEQSSTAIDFNVPGAIQLVGFALNDNIVQRLKWVDGISPDFDFATEHAEAHIWDNQPLKGSNLAIVDGDSATSTEGRFKRFGVSQTGTTFFFDLGTRFPVNRIVFFPRQIGQDAEGRPFEEDFIQGYEILVNNGLDFSEEGLPNYTLLSRVEFTKESIAEIQFPLQFIRYIRLNTITPNPFEIAEFQVYGAGFAPRGEYLSKVIDLGELANYGRLEWTLVKLRHEGDSLAVAPSAEAGISVRMRTGTDVTPQVYYKIVNQYTKERQEVSAEEYNKLAPSLQLPIEDDLVNWSSWSSPFNNSGQRVDLPSPRRFFQLAVAMESQAILDGVRVTSLAVEHAIPPLAKELLGEISLLDDPQPSGGVPRVPAGLFSTLAYDVIADVGRADIGFDAIRIFTPSQPIFREFLIGNLPVSVAPDNVEEAPGTLTLFFPSHRVTSRDFGTLRIVFDAQVFRQRTFFNAEVFDTQSGELSQKVLPGDANPAVLSNTMRVLTSTESTRKILAFFEVVPRLISPNGDGRNDMAEISYTLVQLVRAVETEVEVFDLSGRRVQTIFSGEVGSGTHIREWNGQDSRGKLLPAGVYVIKVAVHTERGTFAQIKTVGVVY